MKLTGIQELIISGKTFALVGFAIKAGKTISGFEAVKKVLLQDKIALVLLNHQISENSVKKILRLANKNKVPVITTDEKTDWKRGWGIENHNIMGILKGEFGKNILENLKQEH